MAAMAALAGRTRRLRFGMNVVSLALRDPVLLAKQCATIDVLSEGRLLPAFGIGSPLGPEWAALDIDTKTRGRRTDESAGDHRPAVARGQRRLRRQALSPERRLDLAQAGAARPADVDRRLVRRRGEAHGEVRHRLAGRRRDAGGCDSTVAAIKKAAAGGRTHHRRGSLRRGFPFYFGSASDPVVGRAMDAYAKRTGRDPGRLVRGRRRRHHPRSRRRIRRRRRPEVHPAPGRHAAMR